LSVVNVPTLSRQSRPLEDFRGLGCEAVWLLYEQGISDGRIAIIIRVKTFNELGTISSNYMLILRGMFQLLVTANVVLTSLIPLTLMMEAIRSSEMSVPTRTALPHIAEGDIHHSHRRKNLECYITLTGWAL
jgi:hypothetical protein